MAMGKSYHADRTDDRCPAEVTVTIYSHCRSQGGRRTRQRCSKLVLIMVMVVVMVVVEMVAEGETEDWGQAETKVARGN